MWTGMQKTYNLAIIFKECGTVLMNSHTLLTQISTSLVPARSRQGKSTAKTRDKLRKRAG